MALSITSGVVFTFPLATSDVVPAIGTSFDLVNGAPGVTTALHPPTADQIGTTPRNDHPSKYYYVRDADSFSDAFSFSMNAGGGGWGASYGMAAAASALLKTSSISQTITFRGATHTRQDVIKPDVSLSAEATKVMHKGEAAFIENYGTHFVAGYIYGKSCNLSYNLNFSTMDFASKFSASFSESESELGFSESMQTAIENALNTSKSHCQFSVDANMRGFKSIAPKDRADLVQVLADYAADRPADETPVLLIVYPWNYLHAVAGSLGGLSLSDPLSQVAMLMNKYIYIQQGCQNFIDSGLYAGATQLQKLSSIGDRAADKADQIRAFVEDCNKNGRSPTRDEYRNLHPVEVESLRDEMNSELARFWLAIVATTDAPDVNVPVNELAQQSANVELSNERRTLKTKATGVYFDWSQQHNMYTINGGTDNFYVGTVGFNLDAVNGTLTLWWGRDNLIYSAAKKIRGIDTTRPPDDPNNSDRLYWPAPGTSISVAVCPD
jgi:hypothetical protein